MDWYLRRHPFKVASRNAIWVTNYANPHSWDFAVSVQKECWGKVSKSQLARHLGNSRTTLYSETVSEGAVAQTEQNTKQPIGTAAIRYWCYVWLLSRLCRGPALTRPRQCAYPRQGSGSYKCCEVPSSSPWSGTVKKHSRRVREHQNKHYYRIMQTWWFA